MKRKPPRRKHTPPAAAPVTLTIEGLAFGGDGVARLDGKTVFVEDAYPGDTVRARYTVEKKTWARAVAFEIVEPSPYRRPAPCPFVADCGGCPWMELDYAEQLRWKRDAIASSLCRIGKIDVAVDEPLAAVAEYGYRARVRMGAIYKGSDLSFGFRRRRSDELIPVNRCAVANDKINTMIPAFAVACAQADIADRVTEVLFEAANPAHKGRVVATVKGQVDERMAERILKATDGAGGIRLVSTGGKREADAGELFLKMQVAEGATLRLGPGSFAQINPEQNRVLVATALDRAGPKADKTFLDLYCGAGNYAIPLALAGGAVTGVDVSDDNIRDARFNSGRAKVVTASFSKEDAAMAARDLAAGGLTFDTVVLNPPRAGAPDAVAHLAAIAKERIVYVSCSPPDLARDAKTLVGAGFALTRVTPVDLFPQTGHVETVALFEKE